jgi:hypothetical protein
VATNPPDLLSSIDLSSALQYMAVHRVHRMQLTIHALTPVLDALPPTRSATSLAVIDGRSFVEDLAPSRLGTGGVFFVTGET